MALVLSGALAFLLWARPVHGHHIALYLPAAPIALLVVLAYGEAGLYPGFGLGPVETLRRYWIITATAFLGMAALVFVLKIEDVYSRGTLAIALTLSINPGPTRPSSGNHWQPLRHPNREGTAKVEQSFLGVHWDRVLPFALPSADALRPPPPKPFPHGLYREQAVELIRLPWESQPSPIAATRLAAHPAAIHPRPPRPEDERRRDRRTTSAKSGAASRLGAATASSGQFLCPALERRTRVLRRGAAQADSASPRRRVACGRRRAQGVRSFYASASEPCYLLGHDPTHTLA